MFRCKGCQAKDDEIRWLRQRVETLEKIKAEVEKPGILRQVEPKPPAKKPTPPPPRRPNADTFPGYEPLPPDQPEVVVE